VPKVPNEEKQFH